MHEANTSAAPQRKVLVLRRALLTILLAAVANAAIAATAKNELTIKFSAKTITVSGLGPGGRAAVFALCREPHRYWSTIVPQSGIIADDTKTGAATFQSAIEIPNASLWAAVDLDTGAAVVATPGDYPVTRVQFPTTSVKSSVKETDSDFHETQRESVYIFWVSPGTGAWTATNGLAAPANEDSTGATTRTSLDKLTPVGKSPSPPKKLMPGDFFLVVDPSTMEFYSNEVLQ